MSHAATYRGLRGSEENHAATRSQNKELCLQSCIISSMDIMKNKKKQKPFEQTNMLEGIPCDLNHLTIMLI